MPLKGHKGVKKKTVETGLNKSSESKKNNNNSNSKSSTAKKSNKNTEKATQKAKVSTISAAKTPFKGGNKTEKSGTKDTEFNPEVDKMVEMLTSSMKQLTITHQQKEWLQVFVKTENSREYKGTGGPWSYDGGFSYSGSSNYCHASHMKTDICASNGCGDCTNGQPHYENDYNDSSDRIVGYSASFTDESISTMDDESIFFDKIVHRPITLTEPETKLKTMITEKQPTSQALKKQQKPRRIARKKVKPAIAAKSTALEPKKTPKKITSTSLGTVKKQTSEPTKSVSSVLQQSANGAVRKSLPAPKPKQTSTRHKVIIRSSMTENIDGSQTSTKLRKIYG